MSLNKKRSSKSCSQGKDELEQEIPSRAASMCWNLGYAFYLPYLSFVQSLFSCLKDSILKYYSFSKAQIADTSLMKPSQMESIAFSLEPPQRGICSFSLPTLN